MSMKKKSSETEALEKLEAFLEPRIEAARKGRTSSCNVKQIYKDVRREHKKR